jgi:hypothetical protein
MPIDPGAIDAACKPSEKLSELDQPKNSRNENTSNAIYGDKLVRCYSNRASRRDREERRRTGAADPAFMMSPPPALSSANDDAVDQNFIEMS